MKSQKSKIKNPKVIVAMSGGVDSSVAAALLKRAGFDVVGVFMKFWSESKKGAENRCCSSEAEKRARKVAGILKNPFYVFNFEKEFKKRIVDYFLKEYKRGVTPNPCVVCNKEIKFGLLLEKTLKLGADFVATGHYVQLRRETRNPKPEIRNYWYKLLKGKDKDKDQSYFLWQLNQKQLRHILFPIGDYKKSEVRKLAKKFKLPVVKTPESQEICFIATTINDFLAKHLKQKPGPIVEKTHLKLNKAKHSNILENVGMSKKFIILGTHQGLAFYTIGQRKGIGLPGGPYYVLDKDLKRNILVVTNSQKDLLKKELFIKNVNWISGKQPKLPLKLKAKIRYRTKPVPATITHLKSKVYSIKFKVPQRAITPGQSVVFYHKNELLGGGIIC